MKLVRPIALTDVTLISTNVPETPPAAYNAVTTYAAGAQVSVFSGTVAAVYESLAPGNLGNTPASSPLWWKSLGTAHALYSGTTLYLAGEVVADVTTHKLYESQVGVNAGSATMTIASPCVVTKAAHGLAADTPVLFATTGALPTGLAAGTIYYVKSPATDTFQLAAAPGGAAINTSGAQSGVHTLYTNPNKGYLLSDLARWVEIGPTNRWGALDDMIGSQTSAPNEIRYTFSPGGFIDHIALLNVYASSIQVIATHPTDGEIYNETVSMISTSGVVDAYTYFTEPIVMRRHMVFRDLPALYTNLTYEVIVSYESATVALGVLLAGLAKKIGETEFGFDTGIIDWSVKRRDDFGRYYFLEREFANTGNFKVFCDNSSIDSVKDTLADYRAQPALYLGTDRFAMTWVYGRYVNFKILTGYANYSDCNIETEGLI